MRPLINTAIPGPRSRALMAELAHYECPAITARHLARANLGNIACPIVLAAGNDVFLTDVDDNCFMDFTAGFGVASVGHAHPAVVAAAQLQVAQLPHAMGDAFPAALKVKLAKTLAAITPGNLQRSIFTNSGSEAVEAALKTAMIRTGRPGIIAFTDSYHGLSYGALATSSYKASFKAPFRPQLNPHIYHLPYPSAQISNLEEILLDTIAHARNTGNPIGAIIFEPILGRGGIVSASNHYLQLLRAISSHEGIVLIADEIYTGFGRTGTWFGVEAAGIVPDIICVGKGMNAGFPIAAAIGSDDAMAGWQDNQGEAIHTSTFLGNPVGCAMSLACIDILAQGLLANVPEIARYFITQLMQLKEQSDNIKEIRGRGLMLGLEFKPGIVVYDLCTALLADGFLVLPCGVASNIMALTPPLSITNQHIDLFISALTTHLHRL